MIFTAIYFDYASISPRSGEEFFTNISASSRERNMFYFSLQGFRTLIFLKRAGGLP
jgi:hypothetical protein